MKEKELEVMCCFCGMGLPFNKAIEITIRINNHSSEVQAVYAHPICTDRVLHKSVPRGFKVQ